MNSAICLAAPYSGSGKTTITLGLMAALKKRGLKIQPFKCGPDYVDTEYHQIAAGRKSRNLDSWLMGNKGVLETFTDNSKGMDISVIEGVMGLYDGPSPDNTEGSTAWIAKTLSVPVILVVDAGKIAGSIAPIVKGFADFDPAVKIAGVIFNKISGAKHFELLAKALKAHSLPPPIGYMPSNPQWEIDERHLGLVPLHENMEYSKWMDGLSAEIEKNIDLDAILRIAKIPEIPLSEPMNISHFREKKLKLKLGLAYDDAFHFYYEDNLDLLGRYFDIVKFSPLKDKQLPAAVAGLYIGGGYPEVFAERLSANTAMLEDIRKQTECGLPVYAECGGLMYLSGAITDKNAKRHLMCGVLPFDTCMKDRLQSFGYKEIELLHDSILGPAGTKLRGHEFHWSAIENAAGNTMPAALATRPFYLDYKEEKGVLVNNVCASYIHLHFKSNPLAAENIYNFVNSIKR